MIGKRVGQPRLASDDALQRPGHGAGPDLVDGQAQAVNRAGKLAVLRADQVSMSFAGLRVLDQLDLVLAAGEVHALVGHNGSGKSTFVKILAGQYTPDDGSSVSLDGDELQLGSPAGIARQGLRVVHQHLGLIDDLSITENIAMGFGYSTAYPFARIGWRRLHARAADQMAELGYDVSPRELVGALSSSTQSAVAVARAMMPRDQYSAPKVVLLDEVTATMPENEIERIASLVRSLRGAGVAVLYVTHHLDEVFDFCDRVTVLRDGRKVTEAPVPALDHDQLADQIVGRSTWRRAPGKSALPTADAPPERSKLKVTELSGEVVEHITFDAEAGSVLGIAGIAGSGREEVAELLLGARRRTGRVELDGNVLSGGNPSASIRAGVALVPADRIRKAVIPNQNVRENVALSRVVRRPPLKGTDRNREAAAARRWIDRLEIRGASVNGSMLTLSGGNQQKVVLARCLDAEPRVLLLDEPTQGVDVGAISEIHGLIKELSRTAIVIVCSSDNRELADLCDTVVVLYRGRTVATLTGAEIDEEILDHLTIGSLRSVSDDAQTAAAFSSDHVEEL